MITEHKSHTFLKLFSYALRLKKAMQKLRLREARFKCPYHNTPKDEGPYIWASLNGPRDHIHAKCESKDCHWSIME